MKKNKPVMIIVLPAAVVSEKNTSSSNTGISKHFSIKYNEGLVPITTVAAIEIAIKVIAKKLTAGFFITVTIKILLRNYIRLAKKNLF